MAVTYDWRGAFTNDEVNDLHAEAFGTTAYDESQWNWAELVHRHSLGWVVARDGSDLVGFVTELVDSARRGAQAAGCQYLHVDFEDHLRAFYYGACGFQPTNAGLLELG